ncbi:MAG TPA: PKD domain-containing protein, partial [Candidatus Thermoplasmatota archaeon]|nr:PKD domain-containing protein [Candidatus Thermoplasmatota archaeon]
FNATNNWWGNVGGPGAGGARMDASGDHAPITSPFATASFALDPCVAFEHAPASPFDWQTVSFDSARAFDPSGEPLSYSWNFNGEGSSATASPTFKFPDGGSKTVTLTVTTAGGKTGIVSQTFTVQHSKPSPAFTSGSGSELDDIAFTDASTHPNTPVDDPPTGWTYSWNFNGEGSSSARSPSFNFADGGSKTITLTVTDDDGQSNSTSRVVSVAHVAPVASFSVSGARETDTYTLTDTSTHPNAPVDGITTRAWTCSDGFASTAATVNHKFPDGPSAWCQLTVGDNDGMTAKLNRTFDVAHVAPSADFTTPGGSELAAIQFTDASTHANAPVDAPPAGWSYSWDFNGEGASTARSPSFDFLDGGAKSITLTATDNDGLQSTASKTVTVAHAAPLASFTFSPANPDPGELVTFTSTSTHPNAPVDSIVSYAWDFDGLGASSDPNPTFTFADQALYNVTLTILDDDGIVGERTVPVPVGNEPPVAVISISPEAPTTLDTVHFDGSASSDADGTIVSYAWDFGDGTTADTPTVDHTYDDGVYVVSLTVTDDLGAATTATQTLTVLNVLPDASFDLTPPNPVAGFEVAFHDHSSDPDGTIEAWAWDFGDGATSAEPSPTHTYASGGDYTVTLAVTDDDGGEGQEVRTIHVCETGIVLEPGHEHVELCTVATLDMLLALVQAVLDLLGAPEAGQDAPLPAL